MTANPGDLSLAAQWLREAQRLVIFTGAGMSAESGIPTFRDDGGFWERFPPEQFASWDGLTQTALRHPRQLAEFLHCVIDPVARAEPNAGHRALAELEQRVDTTVITQNVDGLHQDAGSRRVREVHGSFFRVVNGQGKFLRRLSRADMLQVADGIQRTRSGPFSLMRLLWAVRPIIGLGAGGLHRPNLVLFGQALAEPDWTWAQADAHACDVMLVVGTSGQVWPAASLPIVAKQAGARVIDVDPNEAGNGGLWLRGAAGEVLPKLMEAMKAD